MKTIRTRNLLLLTAIFVFIGGSIALARDGWGGRGGHMQGYGGHMMDYDDHMRGYGGRMGGDGGRMMGPRYDCDDGDLASEDRAKLEEARGKFFDQTREMRRDLDEKRYEMEKELAQENPDRDRVKALQSDISKLRSAFDEKALEHRLEVRELIPQSARGRGYYGGNRGGYCW